MTENMQAATISRPAPKHQAGDRVTVTPRAYAPGRAGTGTIAGTPAWTGGEFGAWRYDVRMDGGAHWRVHEENLARETAPRPQPAYELVITEDRHSPRPPHRTAGTIGELLERAGRAILRRQAIAPRSSVTLMHGGEALLSWNGTDDGEDEIAVSPDLAQHAGEVPGWLTALRGDAHARMAYYDAG
jgi:hypothetical protein